MVFDERSKYCKMHQNFVIFSSIKETQKNKRNRKEHHCCKIQEYTKTSQNAACDTSVMVDTNMRLVYFKEN